ncbi:MAG: LPS export ABC transporter periplasmic protein LptC [Fluviicola sp.]
MMHKRIRIYLGVPAVIIMAGILFSCVNDMDAIERVTYDEQAPDEVTQDLKLVYTDSGYAQVRIKATLAETVKSPKHITRLKDGLRVDFFNDTGGVSSTLTALYGEVNYNTGLMFVRDSVVLYNYEKEQSLETEELFYNRVDSTIYTQKYCVVKKKGKGITGRGMGITTKQSFESYKINKPEGKLYN